MAVSQVWESEKKDEDELKGNGVERDIERERGFYTE